MISPGTAGPEIHIIGPEYHGLLGPRSRARIYSEGSISGIELHFAVFDTNSLLPSVVVLKHFFKHSWLSWPISKFIMSDICFCFTQTDFSVDRLFFFIPLGSKVICSILHLFKKHFAFDTYACVIHQKLQKNIIYLYNEASLSLCTV